MRFKNFNKLKPIVQNVKTNSVNEGKAPSQADPDNFNDWNPALAHEDVSEAKKGDKGGSKGTASSGEPAGGVAGALQRFLSDAQKKAQLSNKKQRAQAAAEELENKLQTAYTDTWNEKERVKAQAKATKDKDESAKLRSKVMSMDKTLKVLSNRLENAGMKIPEVGRREPSVTPDDDARIPEPTPAREEEAREEAGEIIKTIAQQRIEDLQLQLNQYEDSWNADELGDINEDPEYNDIKATLQDAIKDNRTATPPREVADGEFKPEPTPEVVKAKEVEDTAPEESIEKVDQTEVADKIKEPSEVEEPEQVAKEVGDKVEASPDDYKAPEKVSADAKDAGEFDEVEKKEETPSEERQETALKALKATDAIESEEISDLHELAKAGGSGEEFMGRTLEIYTGITRCSDSAQFFVVASLKDKGYPEFWKGFDGNCYQNTSIGSRKPAGTKLPSGILFEDGYEGIAYSDCTCT